jgi:hypothetical protein
MYIKITHTHTHTHTHCCCISLCDGTETSLSWYATFQNGLTLSVSSACKTYVIKFLHDQLNTLAFNFRDLMSTLVRVTVSSNPPLLICLYSPGMVLVRFWKSKRLNNLHHIQEVRKTGIAQPSPLSYNTYAVSHFLFASICFLHEVHTMNA